MKRMIEMQLKASPTIPRDEPKRKEILEEMMRKLMEKRSKTPLTVPITNPNQDLTWIPLAKSKGKEIGRKGFDEESFVDQEPPPKAPIKGGSGFPEGGTAIMELCGGYGGVADHYERHFGQVE
ncbi:hypothetical protein IEQ34_013190 [Dendrobium chrysotoxum]|uniref:Uncharacterized protein n=1 Tax=Dendrobium chrysotoxum TaxID=161865 RepID=A0AAV7G7P2_DENCH|nr:hypothetical protein IEQ34_013190 [Dendrobium chrysotoxum]